VRHIDMGGAEFAFEDDLKGMVCVMGGSAEASVPIEALLGFANFCITKRNCAGFAANSAVCQQADGVRCRSVECLFREGEDACLLGASLLKQYRTCVEGGK